MSASTAAQTGTTTEPLSPRFHAPGQDMGCFQNRLRDVGDVHCWFQRQEAQVTNSPFSSALKSSARSIPAFSNWGGIFPGPPAQLSRLYRHLWLSLYAMNRTFAGVEVCQRQFGVITSISSAGLTLPET